MEMNDFSNADLARIFKIDHATVKKYLLKAEVQPVRRNGKAAYYAASDVLWFKPMIQDSLEPKTADDYNFDREKARETKERADNLELKNAQIRRETVPVELMSWTLGKIGSQMSAILESIPVKIKRRMASLGATEVDIIKGEVAKCQNLCAEVKVNFDEYEGK